MGIRFYIDRDNFNVDTGLIGHWPLNSTDGATDLIGGNDGTLNGGMGYGSGGGRRYAVFDGVDDYVNIPHNAAFDVQSFTISFWCNVTAATGAYSTLVAKTDGVGGGWASIDYAIAVYSGTGILIGQASNAGAGGCSISSPGSIFGAWHHVAYTFNGVDAFVLYLDGSSIGTQTVTVTTLKSAWPIRIGGNQYNPGTYTTGNISDVRIYNRALSAAEVARLAEIIY